MFESIFELIVNKVYSDFKLIYMRVYGREILGL